MFAAVRIVSLLPSATEIVCALGARAELVGRSHECDFPPDVERVPVLTSSRVGPLPSSQAIDASVRDVLRDALAIYQIDVERLRESAPDVIVTQDLCEVCAVSIEDVGVLRDALPRGWRARVYVADGNAFFNRPGPRIVESLEILAACVHPEAFQDLAAKHSASVTEPFGAGPSGSFR